MPDVLVEVRGSWLKGRGSDLLKAVHAGLVEALHTAPDDKLLRLIEHPAENFLIPENAGEKFTRIQIDLFVGRSLDAKRALYQAIVRRLQAFDVPAEDVKIVLNEVTRADVGFGGGMAASDVDLGYSLKI